jgi:hypothetical protein
MTTIVEKYKEPLVIIEKAFDPPPPANPPNIGYQERQGRATRWNPYQESTEESKNV